MAFSWKFSFYKRFRFQIIYRIILLVLLLFLFTYLIFQTRLYATIFIVGLLIIYLVYSIFKFTERTNQELSRFFDAVKYEDYSQSFGKSGLGGSFNDLHKAFAEVIQKIQATRSEKEEQYHYLQNVIQHIGIGLIAFHPQGEVEFINSAAKKLLRVNQLKSIRSLSNINPVFVEKLFQLKSGDKTLIKFQEKDELLHLVIHATMFRLKGDLVTLISIQNIRGELEEKEMEAWQKLIRVLTHEIMNSITPISSLASTTNDMLDVKHGSAQSAEVEPDTLEDVRNAVKTIHRRSEGLLKFVESYRSLTRLPKPDFQIFEIQELFDRVEQLMQSKLNEKKIAFKAEVYPSSLELTADPELMEQVLLNLMLNAVRAVEKTAEGRIEMVAYLNERGRVLIQVTDNGFGIPEDIQDTIFTPFFSTDKNGSGIGLSLCRQIMRLHGGTISVQSVTNGKTNFILRF
ncbi:MAG: ATP-binding protein [Caldithrix sp.]|nr:ATP-binding protein [Caldithrix sp.]